MKKKRKDALDKLIVNPKNIKHRFEVGFNALGMPVFRCLYHFNPRNIKYGGMQDVCRIILEKKLERLVK